MSDQRRWHYWLLGPIALLLLTMFVTAPAGAVDPVAGSQGTDTALPATPSQVTVNGRDAFSGLAITVNQTANLTNQAVSITWTGGTPTVTGPGRFGSQYLQIMQCWGDDDGTVPGNPGPPPEQCEQGAVAATYGGLPGGLYPSGFTLSRVISRSTWANFDQTVGHLDTRTTNVWLPFRSVDGTVVGVQTDPTFNPSVVGGNFWLNPFYNLITTNEIAGAATGPNGDGAELFQIVTGLQSSGLGCGQRVQPVEGADNKIPRCWIVIVPRGTPTDENAGTPFAASADQSGVATSPLAPGAWAHRIAIPIDFNPVDSSCVLGADERRIAGSELALRAVASWQPSLCATPGLPPYAYAPVSDSSARQQLVSGQPGAPGMVVVSRPLSATTVDPAKPVVYAPLSVSGIVIGFNIERNPKPDSPPDAQQLAGVRVADLNLTPRLVAKLLTQSYLSQITIQRAPNYQWMSGNPSNMALDPDFLQFNPEFAQLQVADTRTFSGLELPAGNSDAAQQVWGWVLADPEARAWLDGQPDAWGMKVNPVYATVASANSTGAAFGAPEPNSFPKADPYCYQGPAQGPANSIVPSPLCGTDWMPYARSFADAAQVTRAASDGAKIVQNPFALNSSEVWTRELPQFLGRRNMMAITDTPSAALFGLQTARLSRAGDNGPGRTFVAADEGGLTAGVESMSAGSDPTVLEPAPVAAAPGAYPLTSVAYAAVSPSSLDSQARTEYAAFLDYAAGPGQVAGLELGQLPRGYTPLPDTLRAQTGAAATAVRSMVATPTETTTSVPTTDSTTPLPSTTVETTPLATTPTAETVSSDAEPYTPATPTTVRRGASGSGPSSVTIPAGPIVVSSETAPETTSPLNVPSSQPDSSTTTTTAAADVADTPVAQAPSVITPVLDLAKSRYAVPGLGVMALSSALCALEITKRPRRAGPGSDGLLDAPGEIEQA